MARGSFEMRHMQWGKVEGVKWNGWTKRKTLYENWGAKFSVAHCYEISYLY